MDMYAALMGDPPSDPEKLQALAAALRRQHTLGAVGAATGDRALAPIGQDLAQGADRSVALMQAARQKAGENAALNNWREMQGANTQQGNVLDYAATMARTQEMAQAARDAAEARASAAADRKASADDREQMRKDQQRDRYTAQLSGKLQAARIPSLNTSIGRVNALIEPYIRQGQSIPGVGYGKNTMLGRALLSPEGNEIRSSVQAVVNDLMNLYSGQAVTEPETVRRLQEQALTMFDSPENFLKMWGLAVDRYNNVKNVVRGGYDPAIQQNFKEQSGFSLDDLEDPVKKYHKPSGTPQAAAPAPAQKIKFNGKSYTKVNGQWEED
jgi:hypothetical protein